jgi:hypothetical protein
MLRREVPFEAEAANAAARNDVETIKPFVADGRRRRSFIKV